MENTLDQISNEIDKLRDEMHQLYLKKHQVTSEILILSCKLDEKINEYLRTKDAMKNRGLCMKNKPVKI